MSFNLRFPTNGKFQEELRLWKSQNPLDERPSALFRAIEGAQDLNEARSLTSEFLQGVDDQRVKDVFLKAFPYLVDNSSNPTPVRQITFKQEFDLAVETTVPITIQFNGPLTMKHFQDEGDPIEVISAQDLAAEGGVILRTTGSLTINAESEFNLSLGKGPTYVASGPVNFDVNNGESLEFLVMCENLKIDARKAVIESPQWVILSGPGASCSGPLVKSKGPASEIPPVGRFDLINRLEAAIKEQDFDTIIACTRFLHKNEETEQRTDEMKLHPFSGDELAKLVRLLDKVEELRPLSDEPLGSAGVLIHMRHLKDQNEVSRFIDGCIDSVDETVNGDTVRIQRFLSSTIEKCIIDYFMEKYKGDLLELILHGDVQLYQFKSSLWRLSESDIEKVLERQTRLRDLDLSNAIRNPQFAKKIADLLGKQSKLKSLHLSGNDLGIEGFKHLTSAIRDLKEIQQLYLEKMALRVEEAKELDFLGNLPSLTRLSLDENSLRMEGVSEFLPSLCKLQSLQYVSLESNGLSGEERESVKSEILKSNPTARCHV